VPDGVVDTPLPELATATMMITTITAAKARNVFLIQCRFLGGGGCGGWYWYCGPPGGWDGHPPGGPCGGG
jgi:hypothetical protein